jgi:hypothetical protein
VEKGATVTVDELVYLSGRPPLGEFLGYVSTQTVGGESADIGILASEWRKANDHIRELEAREAGLADNPPTKAVPEALAQLVAQVLADPMFRRTFSIVPAEVRIVELDRLVVYQKHINLSYVQRLKRELGASPTDETVFKVCLPFHHPQPSVNYARIAQNAYVFSSPSTDLRFLEATLIQAAQVTGYSPAGPVSAIVGLVVGFGSNFLNALRIEDRLVLNNGSHRAFALRDIGVTHVPCVVQHVSRREELGVVGPAEVNDSYDLYAKAPRPPLLKDYFDPELRKLLTVPRRNRQVKVTFGVEQIDVPGT